MKQKTVMIVDDDEDLLYELGEMLASRGYRVVECGDAGSARRLARDEKPDAILVDVVMPALNGTEVVELLRGEPACADTPILIMSGRCDGRQGELLARVNRLEGFVPKPIGAPELLAMLDHILAGEAIR